MASSDTEDSEDGALNMFDEPGDYYEPEKPPTTVTHTLLDGREITLNLVGHSALWVGTNSFTFHSLLSLFLFATIDGARLCFSHPVVTSFTHTKQIQPTSYQTLHISIFSISLPLWNEPEKPSLAPPTHLYVYRATTSGKPPK